MPDRDGIEISIDDETLLIAAGVRRDRTQKLVAELILFKDGKPVITGLVELMSDEKRERWVEAACQRSGMETSALDTVITERLVPEALSMLQHAPAHATQQDGLIEMIERRRSGDAPTIELFHDPDKVGYARVKVRDHWETYRIDADDFSFWLIQAAKEELGRYPSDHAVNQAKFAIEAMARHEGKEEPVFIRMAEHDDAYYFDLGDPDWTVVRVDGDDWDFVPEAPVAFRRTRGMEALPRPVRGGRIDELKAFLNLSPGATMWILIVAWLVAALRPKGPYPVLVFMGEQGSAKSSMMRILRALVDPNRANIRSLPRDERELMISANNSWVLCFDNLSRITAQQSDAFCRLSTGGGYAARQLYSDADEIILEAQRPIALNGIGETVHQSDLLDRSLLVFAPSIPPSQRRSEEALWAEFEQARPRILGALLDAVSEGLRNRNAVTLPDPPRLADFAEWIVAAEPALPWMAGEFISSYTSSQREAHEMALEGSPFAEALLMLGAVEGSEWTGTATELLKRLDRLTDDAVRQQKSWPKSARAASDHLRRLVTNLKAVGIDVEFQRTTSKRTIAIDFRTWLASQPPRSGPTGERTTEPDIEANFANSMYNRMVGRA